VSTPRRRAPKARGGWLRNLALALLSIAFAMPRAAWAEIGSDHPAAILVFPKLIVDTANGLDTLIRISNTSDTPINVYCFYVDATPQCPLSDATSCFPNEFQCFRDVGGVMRAADCQAQWQETDFTFVLTEEQPTGWLVSAGEGVDCGFMRGRCASDGTTECNFDNDCPGANNRCVKAPCFPLDGGILGRTGPMGHFNQNSIVPQTPENPFIGELKCIAVDETTLAPVPRNDLKGEVLIGKVQSGPKMQVEVAGYNAIGIPALVNTCQPNGVCSMTGTTCHNDFECAPTNDRNNTLVIGGPGAEYEGCPNILILDHFFDGAVDPLVHNLCQPDGTCSVSGVACMNDNDCVDNLCVGGTCTVTGTDCMVPADCQNTCAPNNTCTLSGEHCLGNADCSAPDFRARVVTNLTLVPCTEDFQNQRPQLSRTTVQFLVFNEFEQRLSTSIPIECFKETPLSNIGTNQGSRSIFSVGTAGTLTGQTRIRGVVNDQVAGVAGNALLGVAEEFRCAGPKFQFPECNFTDDTDRVVSATAKNLHFQGRRPQSDFIYLP